MKKCYSSPQILTEAFALNSPIAAACTITNPLNQEFSCLVNPAATPNPNAMGQAATFTDGICYCYDTAPSSGWFNS